MATRAIYRVVYYSGQVAVVDNFISSVAAAAVVEILTMGNIISAQVSERHHHYHALFCKKMPFVRKNC